MKNKPTVSAAPAPANALHAKHPLRVARQAGVPIIAFETADPTQTIVGCVSALNGKADSTPLMRWDMVRGLVGLNKVGAAMGEIIVGENNPSNDPADVLAMIAKFMAKAAVTDSSPRPIFFYMSAHRLIDNITVSQGIWNLRDILKSAGGTLVLLCSTLRLPDELSGDVVVVTEALPTSAQVGVILDSIMNMAGHPGAVENREKVIDTMLGISAFAAEQALAMSITPDGIDQKELWERKRKMVEQTPGLSVWRDGGSFDTIGGLSNLKAFMTRILTSEKHQVRCIGFIDEIEKMFAGAEGDTSGVSQDQLRVFLTEMQDNNIPGMILVGPPGTGKSAIAKGAGAVAGAEVLSIDTGAMTGGIIGESQAKIRKAMQTFKAVSQGKGFFIATCNRIASLPPELRRRFTLGTFYVDLPNAEERAAIWPMWLKQYGLNAALPRPQDDGWTGAEIRACCDVADRTGLTLVEASEFVVPVSQSSADKIDALRKQAHGRFISANHPGVYEYKGAEVSVKPAAVSAPTRRFDGGN